MNADCLIGIVVGISLLAMATIASLTGLIVRAMDNDDPNVAEFLTTITLIGALVAVSLAAYYLPALVRVPAEHL